MQPELDGHLPPDDLAGHLADHEAVGRDLAADQRGTQAPAALDGDHRAVAGHRAAGEHDPGAARLDHALDHHRHGQILLAEPHPPPVADRLGVVQARPAPADMVGHGVRAAHPQVGVLQAGEAGLGVVLPGGAGPDGHRDRPAALPRVRALAPAEPAVPGDDLVAHVPGQRRRGDPGPNPGGDAGDGGRVVRRAAARSRRGSRRPGPAPAARARTPPRSPRTRPGPGSRPGSARPGWPPCRRPRPGRRCRPGPACARTVVNSSPRLFTRSSRDHGGYVRNVRTGRVQR